MCIILVVIFPTVVLIFIEVRKEIENSGMADYIWKEKINHLPLWNKVNIIDREKHWKRRRLKEAAHMLGYVDLLSRPSIEMNTI